VTLHMKKPCDFCSNNSLVPPAASYIIHLFVDMALCALCASITMEKLARFRDSSSQHPWPDYGGFRHYSLFQALQESAPTCALCNLILYALNEHGHFGVGSKDPESKLPLICQILLRSIREYESGGIEMQYIATPKLT
jgi:hypothetical protein